MNNNRRKFLKKSGILAAGLSLGPLSGAFSSESADFALNGKKRRKKREYEKDAGMKFCYAYFWGAEAEKRKIEFARQMDVLGAVGGINPGTGFRGPIRPDHVPTMAGDSNDRPGYSTLGNLYATGYIRGLMEAVYKSY